MAAKGLRVELFFAGGCSKCAEARDALREAAQSAGAHWSETDIAKHPDRAVDLGVLSTPAVAIGGKLVFKSLPTATELRNPIRAKEAER